MFFLREYGSNTTSWKKEKNTTHIHGIVLTLYNKRGRGQIRSPQGSYSRGFLIFLHWQFSKKPFASNRQVEKNKKRSKSGTTSLELELQLKFVYYQPCNYEIVQTTTTLQKQTLCTLPTYLLILYAVRIHYIVRPWLWWVKVLQKLFRFKSLTFWVLTFSWYH